MMKKFLSLALGLALCLGLAVPAFAADENTSARLIGLMAEKSGIIRPEAKTETYQVRAVNTTDHYGVYEEAEALNALPYIQIPNSADFSLALYELDESVEAVWYAYTDPNGKGVYYERRFAVENEEGKNPSILPIPENGAYQLSALPTSYWGSTELIEDFGFKASDKFDSKSIVLPSNRLHEIFGANTLIFIRVNDRQTGAKKVEWSLFLTGEKPQTVADIFTDVSTENWVSDPVAWAVQNEITNGYGAKDKFAPTAECSEAQILTFLYRTVGDSSAAVTNPMIMAVDKPYQSAVGWAYLHQMIGADFKQDAPCTRAQAVKFIWEALDKPAATKTASFTDVPANADYAEAVSWAVEQGVTNGYGSNDTFAPDKVCNRGEIVTFLFRAFGGTANIA